MRRIPVIDHGLSHKFDAFCRVLRIMATSMKRAAAARRVLSAKLADVPAVVGVSVAQIKDDYCLKVHLNEPILSERIPPHISDVKVTVDIVALEYATDW